MRICKLRANNPFIIQVPHCQQLVICSLTKQHLGNCPPTQNCPPAAGPRCILIIVDGPRNRTALCNLSPVHLSTGALRFIDRLLIREKARKARLPTSHYELPATPPLSPTPLQPPPPHPISAWSWVGTGSHPRRKISCYSLTGPTIPPPSRALWGGNEGTPTGSLFGPQIEGKGGIRRDEEGNLFIRKVLQDFSITNR